MDDSEPQAEALHEEQQDELAHARAYVGAKFGEEILHLINLAADAALPSLLDNCQEEAQVVAQLERARPLVFRDTLYYSQASPGLKAAALDFAENDMVHVDRVLRAEVLDRWRRARLGRGTVGQA